METLINCGPYTQYYEQFSHLIVQIGTTDQLPKYPLRLDMPQGFYQICNEETIKDVSIFSAKLASDSNGEDSRMAEIMDQHQVKTAIP